MFLVCQKYFEEMLPPVQKINSNKLIKYIRINNNNEINNNNKMKLIAKGKQ